MVEASDEAEPEAQSKSEMGKEELTRIRPFALPEEAESQAQDAESNQASSHTRKGLSKPITPRTTRKSDLKVKGKKSARKPVCKRPHAGSSESPVPEARTRF